MVTTATAIQPGTEVHTKDGKTIGIVGVHWPHLPAHWADHPPEPNRPMPRDVEHGYIQIDRTGMLGITAHHWYVPVSDLGEIVEGQTITLPCTEAECDERYSDRPWFAGVDAV